MSSNFLYPFLFFLSKLETIQNSLLSCHFRKKFIRLRSKLLNRLIASVFSSAKYGARIRMCDP